MSSTWGSIVEYALTIGFLEFLGLVFGLLAVFYLIKQNILTWPSGIIYVLISFVIFWQQRLYGDFILHVVFLALNIYGWHFWVGQGNNNETGLRVTKLDRTESIRVSLVSVFGIFIFGLFLSNLHKMVDGLPPASLPYWDSTTSVLSVIGIWLQARKKIENWIIWLVVDVLATGIYVYKGIHFYAVLYGIYILMAIQGYRAWRQSMGNYVTTDSDV